MIDYETLKKNETSFLAMTSLTPSEFEELLPVFDKAWQAYLAEQEKQRKQARQRQPGGGRIGQLKEIVDKLLFILVYYKVYPLQVAQGQFFDLSQGQANWWIHTLTPLLKQALGQKQALPERNPRNLSEILAECDTLDFLIDGTERRRQRPKDNEEQRNYYSGKKKTHTVKNNVLVNTDTQQVVYLSDTVPGKTHDKKLCDQEQYTFPANSLLGKDTGFQGYEPEDVITYQPTKKPRGKELEDADRCINTIISSVRILVEHVIAGIKRCHIVKDVFRNTRTDFADQVMEIACGLHNFRNALRHPIPAFSLRELAANDYFQ